VLGVVEATMVVGSIEVVVGAKVVVTSVVVVS